MPIEVHYIILNYERCSTSLNYLFTIQIFYKMGRKKWTWWDRWRGCDFQQVFLKGKIKSYRLFKTGICGRWWWAKDENGIAARFKQMVVLSRKSLKKFYLRTTQHGWSFIKRLRVWLLRCGSCTEVAAPVVWISFFNIPLVCYAVAMSFMFELHHGVDYITVITHVFPQSTCCGKVLLII